MGSYHPAYRMEGTRSGKIDEIQVMLSGLSLNEWMSNSVMKGLSSLLVAPCPEFGKGIIRRTAFS